MHLRRAIIPFLLALLVLVGEAAAMGDPDVAALQVALQRQGLYVATIDGVSGPSTSDAIRSLQRRAGLDEDGVPGQATRRALGRFARHPLGSRPLAFGARGWDVAALQFLLAWHGFPSATLDGVFGDHVDAALRRFQWWAGLPADGVAGPATLDGLQSPPVYSPLALAWPLHLEVGDPFGPRGTRFHTGIDIPANRGAPVAAARTGRVVFADRAGGFGLLVVIAHGSGVRTFYAHLSRITVDVGEHVAAGARIGRVGSTGHSSGPHLHFEVRVRNAAVDPLPSLP
jgi:peptidoglycan hydrolase-like protein with peptidoglycan-binding domain